MWVDLIQLVESPKSKMDFFEEEIPCGSAVLAPAQEFPAYRPALQIWHFAQPNPKIS